MKEYNDGGGILDLLFWVGFAAASLGLVLGIYMLVRSFYGYVYSHLTFPSELKQYWDGLRAHYSAVGTPLVADREFEAYLQDLLIKATDRNAAINVNRAEFLRKANRAIILVLIASGITAIPYSIRERMKNEQAAVEITRRGSEPMSQRPSITQHPAPVVPPKPTPPTNFDERTGVKAPADRNRPKR
ncbi:MAG TPA: hypothetical protein VF092_25100 [Longimicrobium sp.]